MFAVVFEVRPEDGKVTTYLDLAQHLRPRLEESDGFVAVERFKSRRRPGWMLSLSVWRDEKAVVRWRSHGNHHAIQLQGRSFVFSDYHLRVGEVTADSEATNLSQQRLDETAVGDAKALGLTELPPHDERVVTDTLDGIAEPLGLDLGQDALVDYDMFESLNESGKLLLLTSWKTAEDAAGWTPTGADRLARHRTMRSVRDYTLFDRREAPQFCPVVHRNARQGDADRS